MEKIMIGIVEKYFEGNKSSILLLLAFLKIKKPPVKVALN